MAARILISILAVTIIGGFAFLGLNQAEGVEVPAQVAIDPATAETILASTVKISLWAPALDENGQPKVTTSNGQQQTQYTGGTGLGTLVQLGGELVIVTHDHWKLVDRPDVLVEFSTTQGALLLTLSGDAFRALIRYRDGGTMVLSAPLEIAGRFQPAVLGQPQAVQPGDVLVAAYRDTAGSDAVSAEPMVVIRVEAVEGHAAYELESVNDQIILTGNSGGGVWFNGQFVANMWASLLVSVDGDTTETTQSRAAQLPAGL